VCKKLPARNPGPTRWHEASEKYKEEIAVIVSVLRSRILNNCNFKTEEVNRTLKYATVVFLIWLTRTVTACRRVDLVSTLLLFLTLISV
jgi:hypothetical protein